jgi:hypothetical protein
MLWGYQYLVRAFNISGGSISSNPVVVSVPQLFNQQTDHITITSTPPLDAAVDSLYTYQVAAVSDSPSAVLHYGLGGHPALMVIDSTGLIKWIPQVREFRGVEVVVTLSKGGEARQDFVVQVAGINGKVAGVVADTLNNPLPHVVIHLYKMGIWSSLGIIPGPGGYFDYQSETDSTGHYLITHVDQGKYLVIAGPLNQNYLPTWYDSAITVMDTSTHIVNFALEDRFHLLPKFTISGRVTDSTGAAIKGAWVVFARGGYVFNDARENQKEWLTDENFREFFEYAIHDKGINHNFALDDIHSAYVFRTYVDSNGAYLDTLPEGNYVAFAKANGYHRTFYNNESSLLSADILDLTNDTTNIDFALYPIPPVVLGEISGSVIDSTSGTEVPARMIAFRDIWDYPDTLKIHVASAYCADADSTGAYTFSNLPPGYYKMLALPLGGYAPSFYCFTGPTVKWKEATAVQVDGNDISGMNIYVMQIPDSILGYVSVNGTVRNSSSQTGVSGAVVYATDGNGNVLGYGVTDGTGSYTVSGLAPGSYNLFADVMGYSSNGSNSSSPSYDASGNPVPSTTNLSLAPETPAAITRKPTQPTSYSLQQNYPNPFNPTTTIDYQLPAVSHVTLKVYDVLGREVATLVNEQKSAGEYKVTFDGSRLSSGVYFYKLVASPIEPITAGTYISVKKLVLIK